jgi:hypothetical protein
VFGEEGPDNKNIKKMKSDIFKEVQQYDVTLFMTLEDHRQMKLEKLGIS